MRARIYRTRLRKAILLVVFFSIIWGYLQVGFATGSLKDKVTGYLQQVFDQKVEFEKAVYLPLWGLSIDGLKVTSSEGAQLFSAKNLLLRIPLLPFLLQKKLVISQAVFNEPFVMISPSDLNQPARAADKPFGSAQGKPVNNGAFLSAPQPGNAKNRPAALFLSEGVDPFLPENVYLESVIIRKGGIMVQDHKNKRKTLETIQRLNLEIDFRRQPILPIKGNLYLGKDQHAQLFFEGRWDLKKKAHELKVKGYLEKIPEWLKGKVNFGELAFRRLETDFELALKPQGTGAYAFDFSTKKTSAAVNIGDKRYDGSFSMRLDGAYDTSLRQTRVSSGALDVLSGTLKGMGAFGELGGLKGTLFFDARQVRFRNMQAMLAGTPAAITGRISLTGDRVFRAEIRQRTDRLSALASALPPEAAARLGPESLKGDFTVEARLEGTLDDAEHAAKTAKITLRDAQWKVPELGRTLTQMNGAIGLIGDRIGIHNLFFMLGKDQYLLNGGLELGADKRSELSLKHQKYTARLAFVRKTGFAEVPLLEVKSGKSAISLSGIVETTEDMRFEMDGKASADLDDFSIRFRERWPWLKTLKPSGKAVSQVKLSGEAKRRESWQMSLAAELPRLKLYDKLPMHETNVDIQYAGGRMALTYGKSRIYNGELRFTGETAFLEGSKPSFTAKVTAMDVDLSKAVSDFPVVDKKFSGTLNLNLDLKGLWGAPSTMSGGGNFAIRDGFLFATPLFKRLKNLTFVTIEGMDNVAFDSAEAAFDIAGGYLRTRNMTVSSPLIDIDVDGAVGLDLSLDLRVNSRFTPAVIRESQTLGGFTPLVVNYAEGKITKYEVTGTLTKPVYKEV